MSAAPGILYLYQHNYEDNHGPGRLQGDGTAALIVEKTMGCNKGLEGMAIDRWMPATGRSTVLVQKMRGKGMIAGHGRGDIENKGSGGSDSR